MMDIALNMKYQAVHWLVNMVYHYPWLIIHRFFLHHSSIGVRIVVFVMFIEMTKISCLDSRNYNQEGYGEFGFQMTLSERPARILITAPGSFYFRGIFLQSIVHHAQSKWLIRSSSFTTNSWTQLGRYTTSVYYTSLSLAWSWLGSISIELFFEWIWWLVLSRYKQSHFSKRNYSIFIGYAVAVGNFNHDYNQEVVVSVPKLDHYRGAVEILNSNLDEHSIRTIYGIQMGEYFGASLCVVDINNDG